MSSTYLLHFDLSQGCTASALCASLLDLGASFKDKKLGPVSIALLQRTKNSLTEVGYAPTELDLDELVKFCLLLTDLDPKAISATKIPLSFAPDYTKRTVLFKLSDSVPVYEQEWPAPSCDMIGLALLKTCVAHFGARGESRLIKMGLGVNPEVRALLCEPAPLATRQTVGVSAEPRISSLVEVSALITNPNLISELTHRLNQIGCKKVWATQVLEQGTQPKSLLTVIASEADQHQVVEVLLILGGACEVFLHLTEQHSLQKRTVSVTLGTVQKQRTCRVVESLWGDRVLRADPLSEDLISLSKATGNPQEIVRADVLSAWKKRVS